MRQSQLQCTSFHCMLPFAATPCSAHYADHQAHSNNLTRQLPVQCLIQTTLMRDCPSLNTILFGETFPSDFHINNSLTKSHPSFKDYLFFGETFPSDFHVNNTLTKSHPTFKTAFFFFFFFLPFLFSYGGHRRWVSHHILHQIWHSLL